MRPHKTIPQAMRQVSKSQRGGLGNASDVYACQKRVFEDTKVPGEILVVDSKIVMFDGTEENSTMLINVGGQAHVEVPLTKAKIFILLDHLNKLIQTGRVR